MRRFKGKKMFLFLVRNQRRDGLVMEVVPGRVVMSHFNPFIRYSFALGRV